jgi:hypothetical protein
VDDPAGVRPEDRGPEPPAGPDEAALTLLPEVRVRELLRDRKLTFRLLVPPYPALGLGVLRVLRVAERDGSTELVAGYEGYERLGKPPPAHERRPSH